MKSILIICLIALSVIYSCKQQPAAKEKKASKECLYHIKFYTWQWDYCKLIGYDTIPKYSKTTGDHIGDTIIWDTSLVSVTHSNLNLPIPFPDSFINSPQKLSVTSSDNAKNYEVTSFDIVCQGTGQNSMTIDSSTISTEGLKQLDEFVEKNYLFISRIFLEIHLKGIKDMVETSYSAFKPIKK